MKASDVPEQTAQRLASTTAASADATGGEPLDRIFVHDYVLDSEIGVYSNEKGVTQRVRVSVDVEIGASDQPLQDDIHRTFDYDVIINAVKEVVGSGHINLTETMAEEIAARVLNHPRAQTVKVKVEKLDKDPGAVGTEIMRKRRA
ncbi:putative dihydroneopterin aldolase [Methyloligella halotolerans]|uniref:dihydroneopterin aldolase n=1 Tax=Methyloligella halotolerans TaxID=1177755 RepID=A0A1E2S2Q7_9HYPH|nr:dihydroneopterin aldolase [Methyloligella halotolerans]ODA68803.1 putative dihydroneopterin aldolase [Methyloligella halotolerans]